MLNILKSVDKKGVGMTKEQKKALIDGESKTRKVEVKEVLSRVVEVEASTDEEAIEIVERMYRDEELVLSADDFQGDEISIFDN